MNKLFKLKKITSSKDGFTTFEILISLFIALLFVAVSMQSLVYAMAMKVQAQEKQRANELIQEDIERINRLGSTTLIPPAPTLGNPPAPTPVCNPVATVVDTTTIPGVTIPARTAYENSYAQALWNSLQTAASGTETTTSESLRKTLIKKVDSTTGATQRQGKTLALKRFHVSEGSSTTPHRTLKVGYQVWNWDDTDSEFKDKNGGDIGTGDEPIAETYVEIIPDVALQCP